MNDHYINQPVGQKELEALRMIAKEEEIDFFRRNAHLIGAYRDRLIAVALCQGAALQFSGHGHGVKDFDLHFFYLENPAKPRLSRAVKRIHTTIGAFPDIQVDFIRTIVPYDPVREQMEGAEQVRGFLGDRPSQNAFHLAKQPVIGLIPDDLFSVISRKDIRISVPTDR